MAEVAMRPGAVVANSRGVRLTLVRPLMMDEMPRGYRQAIGVWVARDDEGGMFGPEYVLVSKDGLESCGYAPEVTK